MRFKIALAAMAATAALASPAGAQVTVSANADAQARGVVLQPLTLVQDDDLDFGTVLSTPIAGTVTIDPNGGPRATSPGVTGYALAPGHRAVFTGNGTNGQTVTITVNPPSPAVLDRDDGGPEKVDINWLSLDGATGGYSENRVINDVDGFFSFGVGGQFQIDANQREGAYSADYTVTVDY